MLSMSSDLILSLITPFDDSLEIDYNVLRSILDDAISNGVTSVLIGDMEAEVLSLDDTERIELYQYVSSYISEDITLIANVTKCSTDKTIKFIASLASINLDSFLLTIPYGICPNRGGTFLHIKTLVNLFKNRRFIISGNNTCPLDLETIFKLVKECPNIVGLRLRKYDLMLLNNIRESFPELSIYVEEQAGILNILESGVHGIVSSLANTNALDIVKVLDDFGKGIKNQELDIHLSNMFEMLNLESPPVVLKHLLSKKGYESMNLRLPLMNFNSNDLFLH